MRPDKCPTISSGGIPDFNACRDCKEDCVFYGDCYNCAKRSRYNSSSSGHPDFYSCHKVYLMRVGAGHFTPSQWMWDDEYCVDEVPQLVHLYHSSNNGKKFIAYEYLKDAFLRAENKENPLTNDQIKAIITNVNLMTPKEVERWQK